MIRAKRGSHICCSFFICAVCLLQGCGVQGKNGTSTSSTGSSSAQALTASTTETSLDSSVPGSAAALIIQAVSVLDAKPLGSPLSIPSDGTGFSTEIFAVDKNQNIILAALSSSQTPTTQFSARSTAEALVTQALAVSVDTIIASQLVTIIDAAPSFPSLVSDIQAALSSGTSPLLLNSVATDIGNVTADVVSAEYQQESVKPFLAHSQAATQNAGPPLPYQIIGPIAAYPTIYSVYINSPNPSNGGVNLRNSMPIAFAASSDDPSGSPISNNVSLPEFNIAGDLFFHQSLVPQDVPVGGNGQRFVLTISEVPAQWSNLTTDLADFSAFLLGQALGLKVDSSPQLQSCATDGAKDLVNALISANSSITSSVATGRDLSNAMVATFSTNLVSGVVSGIVQCARPDLSTNMILKTVLQSLPTYLTPYLGEEAFLWKAVSFAWGARSVATEMGETIYYWNTSVPVNVCEASDQLTSCPPEMSLAAKLSVTPLTKDGWSGSGNLTINTSNGTNTYTGDFTSDGIDRTESGTGDYYIPPHQAGVAFTFQLNIGYNWINGGPQWEGTGEYHFLVLATPAQGGYSLSPEYPDLNSGYFGDSNTSFTVSGFYTGP